MVGTLVNTGAIVGGSLLGLMIRSRLSERMTAIVFQGIGLVTIAIGVSMSLQTKDMILVVVSIVSGAILGQAVDIDKYLRRFSDYLRSKTRKEKLADDAGQNRFTEGFVTASMLFCVGSMAILGAIEDGMGKNPDILLTKSVMDGISSVALAASFGVCILFSSIPVLIYQGSLTLFAAFIMRYMSDDMTANMTGVGGILLIGLGISILKIKDINVTNMLPALVIIVILSYFF
ncbi:putative membrane protein YqgA involved in biofilm formation [Dysgonomonas sp. PFB1-18]|uniref:DUF554 domain-containing protein n=1 Tax=unclassified Dysgonomonas TaxID=2630389 RepID=UPI002476350C|nr:MULTISPECIES: DUF554 domain-containing protein [unclassified Dysgonomonas]MDH6307103.1 putative membrane protein YqgA involved in biofilm formation [Dysgonomonas sp. PF1-14]MDH6337022.1 putative membrane protein YqgA involved in biofilm formation [Dysgonomonas sp. PF1-16]MDH6381008.1 putative membrane protein YqgA involved in biofilm formation [Dysgonomonas sp. PFB1-18]MDH6396413.1 putative membrane protein YqgA involved in biofilm formation [Dysgonomonas sp. PF1-23]